MIISFNYVQFFVDLNFVDSSVAVDSTMSSFTHEQVAHFRQVFSQYSDEDQDGVTREKFPAAVQASFDGFIVAGRAPSAHYLEAEFQRIAGDSGVVQWQQFFQVCAPSSINMIGTIPATCTSTALAQIASYHYYFSCFI